MSEVRDVTTWYLQMLAVSELRPSRIPSEPHRIERVEQPSAAFARYLYTAVGGCHQWFDRLPWSQARWDAHLRRELVHLYTLQLGGAPIGYVELEQQPRGDVQIIYFGLTPEHQGKGFGGALLTRAVQLAWQLGDARRVWVHTCTLDAPSALPNYQARGFSIFRQKTEPVELPEITGPWPGWDATGT
ncbi:MAG: GCN5-related N-acetyltransferase [Polyangiaceae bacterium]|jgi:GNAT superfamily N-acetyltransferase|nr:GCN5-related N-acetyltransferase [Polyangiaceae bacterium]